MIFPNIPQLIFKAQGSKKKLISGFVEDKEFIFFLLSHLKNYFNDLDLNFSLTDPLLDPTLETEQNSSLTLNGFEIGEISLNYNSIFDEVSLVYYSSSGFLKTTIIDSDSFERLTINDYLILLHEFSAILRSEYDLYINFHKN